MVTYERIQVIGRIGMCEFLRGQNRDFYKLRVCPGERKIRGELVTVWYNVVVSTELIKDRAIFERMYAKGRLVVCEGVPTAEAFTDRTSGAVRAETTISCRVLPTLLDSPNKANPT